MAEINTASPANAGGKARVRKSKKLSTKVDLTPMVDLGFLLITFFMISVHMTEPTAAELKMPADSRDSSQICESCALTVIPNGDGKIFYYHGNLENALRTGKFGITNFDYKNGIGRIIRENRAALMQKGIAREDFMLLIKPTEEAAYGDVVDLFDEVLINGVTRYAIINIQPEREGVNQKQKPLNLLAIIRRRVKMSKKPISTSRKILYWIIALLCTVLLAELFCRAYYYRRSASSSLALVQLFRDSKKLVNSGLGGNQNDSSYRPDLSANDHATLSKENKAADHAVYQPWVQFYFRDYKGEFVNVENGVRRSIPSVSDSSAKEPFTILFLGGSTMFGYNLRDEETIPSLFTKEYKRRYPTDRPIRVINQGIPYYFSYQELMLLTHKLYTEEKPDMVIMLDGLNDCMQLYSAFYRQPYFSAAIAKFVNPGLAELAEDYSYYNAPSGIPEDSLYSSIANNYLTNIATAKFLSDSYDIELYCFWQPVPFYNYPNRDKDPVCAKFEKPAFDIIYPKINSATSRIDYLFYLGDMLQNEKGSPFVDKTHYSVEMNQKIVEEMMRVITSNRQ